MNKRFLMLSVFALAIALIASSYFSAFADSVSVNFESGYTIGNVNGQNGWLSTGSFDQAVFTNSLYPSFGTKALRISDAVTSGSFGDQTFAPALVNAAGELDSTDGAFSRGILQKGFEIQFDIASSTPSFQPGMHTSVSPDRGDGSRMSYLRFEDSAIGLNVFFDDVQQPVPCVPTGCANFVETQVGTNLSRATPHTIKLSIDFVNGPSNDIVKVYIDGALVHTGTSWEDYYRFDPEASAEQTPRIVKTVLFREGGDPNLLDSGNGFLFDNITSLSRSVPTNAGQCKDGGWQKLTRSNATGFKNQGDCIQFVNTGK